MVGIAQVGSAILTCSALVNTYMVVPTVRTYSPSELLMFKCLIVTKINSQRGYLHVRLGLYILLNS